MSRAVAKIDDKQVADMDLDITFRFKVSEWHEIMRKMPVDWPNYEMSRYISAVLGHVTRATDMTFTEPKHEG